MIRKIKSIDLNGGMDSNFLFVNKYDLANCMLPWQVLSIKARFDNENKYNVGFNQQMLKDYILLYIKNDQLYIYTNKLDVDSFVSFLTSIDLFSDNNEVTIQLTTYNLKDYYNMMTRYASRSEKTNIKNIELLDFDNDLLIDYYKTYINQLKLNISEQNDELMKLINDYDKAYDEYCRYRLADTQIKFDQIDNKFKNNKLDDSLLYKELT